MSRLSWQWRDDHSTIALHECLTIREQQLPDDWVLFHTQSLPGGALGGQQKFAEAEPLLVAGYSGMQAREAQIPANAKVRLTEALQRLVDLYTAWDKPDAAAKWQKKLDEAKSAAPASKPEKDPARP